MMRILGFILSANLKYTEALTIVMMLYIIASVFIYLITGILYLFIPSFSSTNLHSHTSSNHKYNFFSMSLGFSLLFFLDYTYK